MIADSLMRFWKALGGIVSTDRVLSLPAGVTWFGAQMGALYIRKEYEELLEMANDAAKRGSWQFVLRGTAGTGVAHDTHPL